MLSRFKPNRQQQILYNAIWRTKHWHPSDLVNPYLLAAKCPSTHSEVPNPPDVHWKRLCNVQHLEGILNECNVPFIRGNIMQRNHDYKNTTPLSFKKTIFHTNFRMNYFKRAEKCLLFFLQTACKRNIERAILLKFTMPYSTNVESSISITQKMPCHACIL